MDRNAIILNLATIYGASLSARRAWIEIIDYIIDYATDASLSARRAWIEIVMQEIAQQRKQVALRKESVDRNANLVLNA